MNTLADHLRRCGLCLLLLWPGPARSQLTVAPQAELPAAFGGRARDLPVLVRNPKDQPVTAHLQTRLLQASSATAIPLGIAPWKELQVLPGQTVVDTARVTFPAVQAETRFLVQWLDKERAVLGTSAVLVYPTNLLAELRVLAADQPLGVLDPGDQLKPLLAALQVEFEDLNELDRFTGKLAVIAPFGDRDQLPPRLAARLVARCKTGLAAVWIQPPPAGPARLEPSFYPIPIGEGMVVIAQATLLSDLANDPSAQLNLVRLARWAVRRQPLVLPGREEFEPD